jgi:hypothetical protein
MKPQVMPMTEPTASTAAGLAGWKLIGGAAGVAAGGAGLAAIVVMCMTPPRSPREWAVGLICTVMGSIAGGAAVIQYLGLQAWMHDVVGLVAVLGIVFACGLPGWTVVRWVFNWMDKRRDADIAQVVGEVRQQIGGSHG